MRHDGFQGLQPAAKPGRFLAGLGSVALRLVALALGGGQPLGLAVCLGRHRLALLLVGLLGRLGLGLHLHQLRAHLVALGGGRLGGLPLLGLSGARLVGRLVRPLQVGTQLAGAALDLGGTAVRGREVGPQFN